MSRKLNKDRVFRHMAKDAPENFFDTQDFCTKNNIRVTDEAL